MGIKELRNRAGLKQSELAAISGVNLRSLQDYEQGHKSIASAKGETLLRLSQALNCSIEDILMDDLTRIELSANNDKLLAYRIEQYAKRIQDRKNKVVHFPTIETDEIVDMSRIYPTKQPYIKRVLMSLRDDQRIESLRLFGSSITMACNKNSDIDIAVGVNNTSSIVRNEISEKIQVACDWGADVIWLDHLMPQERIYTDIMKGLVLI